MNFINRGSLEVAELPRICEQFLLTICNDLGAHLYIGWFRSNLLPSPFEFPQVALWERCYPEYWMGSDMNAMGNSTLGHRARGTYAQSYNEQHLSDGPLQPFRTEQRDYWTSSQAQFLHEQSYPKYYSFPEFEGIEVDQAATSFQERASACKKVQTYHGFDPQTNAKQVGLDATKHLPVLNKEDPTVPSDHTIIPCYRTFAVHVKLLEHAYNRFYSFQLYHKGSAYSSPQLGSFVMARDPLP
ncbi:hypothetical protein EV424DRAFT_1352739 [Suillus variegatus]|nr:hypothetical protein EV424DRAFT_1352739 [Suillus variegatus]